MRINADQCCYAKKNIRTKKETRLISINESQIYIDCHIFKRQWKCEEKKTHRSKFSIQSTFENITFITVILGFKSCKAIFFPFYSLSFFIVLTCECNNRKWKSGIKKHLRKIWTNHRIYKKDNKIIEYDMKCAKNFDLKIDFISIQSIYFITMNEWKSKMLNSSINTISIFRLKQLKEDVL